MAPIQLIHSEQQLAPLHPAVEPYACCVDPTQWPVLIKPLVLILTTQHTRSTLLCQDIASTWQLTYQPKASFVPPLTGIFNNSIPPQALPQQLANTHQQHNQASCSVFKLLSDYICWLGFFCSPKEQALSATYIELSADFPRLFQTNSPEEVQLIQLNRKQKLKQSISCLFSCMGLPNHIHNDEDQKSCDAKLAEKLAAYPNLELMVIDQLRMILGLCSLIEAMLNLTTGISLSTQLEFERDHCQNTQTYLNPISYRKGFKAGVIQRQLCRKSGTVNKDLSKQTLQCLGLYKNEAKGIEQAISEGQ